MINHSLIHVYAFVHSYIQRNSRKSLLYKGISIDKEGGFVLFYLKICEVAGRPHAMWYEESPSTIGQGAG